MSGRFVLAADVAREELDWGTLGWLCHPPNTGARDLTVIEAVVKPGLGHDFHKHPDQEEVIVVVSGKVEQWLEQEKQVLNPGDSIFIGKDVVHASFNLSDSESTMVAILGPCVGDGGYEVVEVAGEEPWKSLR